MYDEDEIYYHTCPLCGANLDPGESCDCDKEESPEETPDNYHDVGQPDSWYHIKKVHPLATSSTTPFVCMSDILNDYVPNNKVVYNPTLSYRRRRELLYDTVNSWLHIKLTANELTQLCQYNGSDAHKFINHFKRIITNKK